VTESRTRILVVDDRRDQLMTLEATLADVVDDVVCATSGRDALRLLLEPGEFAVMLLDIQMPGMSGFDLAEMIRQHRVHRETPIIFVTASADDLHVERCYALGAVDYILSPVVPTVLRTKVSVLVDLHKKTQQVRLQAEVLRRRATQLHSLTSASLRIHAAASLSEILHSAAEAARDIVGAEYVVATAAPAGQHAPAHTVEVRGAGPRSEPAAARSMPRLESLVSWSDGQPLGVIQVSGKAGGQEFNADDEAVVAQIAHVTSVAVQNRILGDAREANRLKDEFFTNLSHELRNPLNAVVGWVHLLKTLPSDETTKGRALDALERNTSLLMRLVDDLLDVSRIASNRLAIVTKPIRLEDAVRSTVESLSVTADTKGVRVEFVVDDGPLEMLGDAQRLTQAVWNLVINALKFTPRGGQVTVRLAREGGEALLVVEDNGEGIAPGFLPHLFDRFRQARADRPNGHGAGLGLGLSIVRAIVELHGGIVWAESRGLGQGARFTIRLPLLAARSGLDGYHTLLIEPDGQARATLERSST
jgi:signal transduction histidine kinase